MIPDSHLVGWLCILRLNLDEEGAGEFYIPSAVKEGLEAKGWVTLGESDWRGSQPLTVTDAGTAVSDLAAPEWGIDPIPA